MSGIADWHISPRASRSPAENELAFFSNLAFGQSTDVPSPGSNEAGGHMYAFQKEATQFNTEGVVIRITRNNSFTRGFNIGGVRVGFRKTDVEPPFATTSDDIKDAFGVLFCYAQEVNGVAETEPSPDPIGRFDIVRGAFQLVYSINFATDDVLLQLRSEGRLLAYSGGGPLTENVSVPLTKSPGDFIGIELNWFSSTEPTSDPRPKVILRGITYDQPDFSDPVTRVAAAHDYKFIPIFEQTPFRKAQNFLWNIAGTNFLDPSFLGRSNPILLNPLLEGADIELGALHGYAMTHFEILKL